MGRCVKVRKDTFKDYGLNRIHNIRDQEFHARFLDRRNCTVCCICIYSFTLHAVCA